MKLKEAVLQNYDILSMKEISEKFGYSYFLVKGMMTQLNLHQHKLRNSVGLMSLYRNGELIYEFRFNHKRTRKEKFNEWTKMTKNLQGKFFIEIRNV